MRMDTPLNTHPDMSTSGCVSRQSRQFDWEEVGRCQTKSGMYFEHFEYCITEGLLCTVAIPMCNACDIGLKPCCHLKRPWPPLALDLLLLTHSSSSLLIIMHIERYCEENNSMLHPFMFSNTDAWLHKLHISIYISGCLMSNYPQMNQSQMLFGWKLYLKSSPWKGLS